MEKTTMSVQELSAHMGISLPKAYELVKTPGFPTIRVGTRILIPIEADTTIFTECRCQTSLLMYAATLIAPIWQNRE